MDEQSNKIDGKIETINKVKAKLQTALIASVRSVAKSETF